MGVQWAGRGRRVTACAVGAALVLSAGPPLGAQVSPADPTSTTTTTSTTAPPSPDAAPPPSTVATSLPPAVPTGSVPAGGPVVEDAVEEVASERATSGQPPFDLASMAVLAAELTTARRRLAALERQLGTELRAARTTVDELARLEAASATVDASETARAVEAATARESLRRAVVGAYVLDGADVGLVGMLDTVDDLSRARVYLRSLADHRRGAFEEFAAARDDLGELGRGLLDGAAPLQARRSEQEARAALVATAVRHARSAVDAFEAGSHIAVDGFRFPVLGPVTFVDSWGFPRMPGTPSAHWHEGTDVIAPIGRELVAVEDGVLHGVGQAGLGGTKLWLLGASGTDYYYAHLSAFAPGVVDGAPVVAGQVVGFVGDTGNARGGVPHLHFEIHPAAGAPVNPFPLLWTSLGRPALPSQADVLAGPAAVLPPGVTVAP